MKIEEVEEILLSRVAEAAMPREVLRSPELKQLYAEIPKLPADQRGEFGRQINQLKQTLEAAITARENAVVDKAVEPIDITAPFDVNGQPPEFLPTENGTIHPLSRELSIVIDIFTRMGFEAVESRQIDDDYHMFTSLNFPEGHPARDMYDTFHTEDGFIPPGHTSTMQNRILKTGREKLEKGGQIASISYGRVFRNEDQDVTHEHTFYQCEGVFVSQNANFSQLVGVLKSFLETYYSQSLRVKTQPGYFPFTEPSIEIMIERPKNITSISDDWIELVPGGMIHPNVLSEAGIDSTKYQGFAWGLGIERLVMLKYGIEDLRHFESGKLAFLREFK